MHATKKVAFPWCPHLLQEKKRKQANNLQHPANTSVDSHNSFLGFYHGATLRGCWQPLARRF
jgi:hypothetical protein